MWDAYTWEGKEGTEVGREGKDTSWRILEKKEKIRATERKAEEERMMKAGRNEKNEKKTVTKKRRFGVIWER